MVKAKIPRDGFKPAARRRAVAQLIEPFVGPQENLLRDILGVLMAGEQTHGGAKYHVLVVPHEDLELLRIGHGTGVTIRGVFYA
jgi:hypothetical protein